MSWIWSGPQSIGRVGGLWWPAAGILLSLPPRLDQLTPPAAFLPPHQLHRTQQSRRLWHNRLHILRLEPFPVLRRERLVAPQGPPRHPVQRRVPHHHADRILARLQQLRHLHLEGRAPHRPSPLSIHI